MAILYTQLLKPSDLQILACSFSVHGRVLSSEKKILLELRNIIQKMPDRVQNVLYDYKYGDIAIFYIYIINDVIYALITDKNDDAESVMKYINRIYSLFTKFCVERGSKPYTSFEEVLRAQSDIFNSKSDVFETEEELKMAKDVCIQSLDKVFKRGEKIDNLLNLADRLKVAAQSLQRNTRRMYYQNLLEQYSLYIVFALIILLVFYFFIR
ncbi:putative synaptobrevin [Hamiltosporidium tvaerminnensis]|uniref:Putative synaptobrevin n=2 Tax=Hamiltosporidium TaxID=1176354 RepID=A0A4Q9LI84_9MICR|nr:hypothetical protein LUQ84_000783 [Hamiltosporidium tvaerminnensis]TBU03526.1 putative synaptobrevin [Hamiltosporidium tvaerminnensis]TBU07873.1 putative synaptobrevin [Hamiltosporidium magnivora]TBU09575.1 putative synaptobrevin [Hamiltosporidium magnivora]TBU19782.1 putative synaptobrevin [Hamiltosporidium tvaerminnensis]